MREVHRLTAKEQRTEAAIAIWALVGTLSAVQGAHSTLGLPPTSPLFGWLIAAGSLLLLTTAVAIVGRQPGSLRTSLLLSGCVAWAFLPFGAAIGLSLLSGAGLLLTTSSRRFLISENSWLDVSGSESAVALVPDREEEELLKESVESEVDSDLESRLLAALDGDKTTTEDAETLEPDAHTTFWLTRKSSSDGIDRIQGGVTLDFPAGIKTLTYHLPFSPPLPSVPTIECEQVGGSPVRVKEAFCRTYGARLEIRRAHAETDDHIELLFDVAAALSADRLSAHAA